MEIDNIIINYSMVSVLTGVVVQSFLQEALCYVKQFSHFVAVLAAGLVAADDSKQTNHSVVSPGAGAELLLAIIRRGLIQNISDGSMEMSDFLS